MSFRPTAGQALGRGAYLGGLVGLAVFLVMVILAVAGLTDRFGVPEWFAVASPLLVGPAIGASFGLTFGRDAGVDIDDLGIYPVPRTPGSSTPWQRIEDLRAERRGGRTHVAVYLDSGQIARLLAPYNGRMVARDPGFERKLFMLRHLWETHRSFLLPSSHLGDGG